MLVFARGKVMTMVQLTPKQERFVEEYLVDLNASAAAIRAGYSAKSAFVQGSRLLSNARVRARVEERMAELSRRTGVTQERVIRELARIALLDATRVANFDDATLREDAAEDDRAAIASVKVKRIPTDEGDIVEREIRFWDKNKALELLGKHLGMFQDKAKLPDEVRVRIVDDVPVAAASTPAGEGE